MVHLKKQFISLMVNTCYMKLRNEKVLIESEMQYIRAFFFSLVSWKIDIHMHNVLFPGQFSYIFPMS